MEFVCLLLEGPEISSYLVSRPELRRSISRYYERWQPLERDFRFVPLTERNK
jgi:hypothetical protein